MARKYKDNSIAPIVAIDFDGTISVGDSFPQPKEIRKFAKEVINFLVDCGIKVVIYTSRDVAINQDTYTVYDDITNQVTKYLVQRAEILTQRGVGKDKIILDPGIGFAKNTEQNLTIMRDLASLTAYGYPVLLAASRKTVIATRLHHWPQC